MTKVDRGFDTADNDDILRRKLSARHMLDIIDGDLPSQSERLYACKVLLLSRRAAERLHLFWSEVHRKTRFVLIILLP